MKNVINYQNLGTLMNLTETISKLDEYLFHIKNYLETELKSFKTDTQLNVKEKEYVVIQKLDDLTIKAGFNWLYDDIYFGVRIYVPKSNGNSVLDLTDKLKEYQWGYGKEEKHFVVSHERRLIDQLFTNDEPENEWSALIELFTDRINECKIITKELRKVAAA